MIVEERQDNNFGDLKIRHMRGLLIPYKTIKAVRQVQPLCSMFKDDPG
jgi:hypothetical protein